MIQMDEADKLARKWSGGECNHIWEKELYLGTKTGDYRCTICGQTCSEISMEKLKQKAKESKPTFDKEVESK